MNRWLAGSLAGTVAAFTVVSLSIAGCGGSSGNGSDSGSPETGKIDHHVMPVDGGKDVQKPPPDGAKDVINPFEGGPEGGFEGGEAGGPVPIPAEGGPTVPAGAKQILNAEDAGFPFQAGFSLTGYGAGLTDDGYVVYCGTTMAMKFPCYAMPIAGGAPEMILADLGTAGYGPLIIHDTVFFMVGGTADPTTMNVVGTVTFWTHAKGAVTLTGKTSSDEIYGASPDGTKVVYTVNASSNGTTSDLVAANADGTGATTLLTGTTTNSQGSTTLFAPDLGFVNDTYFVAMHQEGTGTPTLSFWDTATWTKTDLVTGAAVVTGSATPALTSGFSWGTSLSGTGAGNTIVAATGAGALESFVLPSVTPVAIDTSVTSFTVATDGAVVLYGTMAGAYKKATLTATPTLTTILSTGFGGVISGFGYPGIPQVLQFPNISPDDNWSLFYKIPGTSSGSFDLNLINNVASATPTSLLGAPTGSVFNDAFTFDSKFALYYTNFLLSGSDATGTVNGYGPLGGSAKTNVIAPNVWNSYAVSASKVIYNDNFVSNAAGTAGYADIKTIDLSAATPSPVTIIVGADDQFFLTNDKKTLVFSVSLGNTKTDGIYTYTP